MQNLRPPTTVYHGTDSKVTEFDTDSSIGAHFGTQQAAVDRLRDTGRLKIVYEPYEADDGENWMVQDQTWANRPRNEHGPFATKDLALEFCDKAPKHREPQEFEIDVYRPLEMEDLGTWTFEALMTVLSKPDQDTDEDVIPWHVREDIWSAWNRSTPLGWATLKGALNEAGYDCIAYRNQAEDIGSVSWIVFDSTKIFPKYVEPMDSQPDEQSLFRQAFRS